MYIDYIYNNLFWIIPTLAGLIIGSATIWATLHIHKKDNNIKKAELNHQKKIRRDEIKPYFKYKGGGSGSDGNRSRFINVKGTAKKIYIEPIEISNIILINKDTKIKTLDTNEIFELDCKSKDINIPHSQISYEVNIHYSDIDDNKYFFKVNMINGNLNYDDAVEI